MTDQDLNSHVRRAQRFLAMQRKRSLFFANDGLFGNPAWELLLEIYIATETQDCISKPDLFGAISTTPTIASRWIGVFVDHGYVTRCEDHGDDRICMTQEARADCIAYLDAVTEL